MRNDALHGKCLKGSREMLPVRITVGDVSKACSSVLQVFVSLNRRFVMWNTKCEKINVLFIIASDVSYTLRRYFV